MKAPHPLTEVKEERFIKFNPFLLAWGFNNQVANYRKRYNKHKQTARVDTEHI